MAHPACKVRDNHSPLFRCSLIESERKFSKLTQPFVLLLSDKITIFFLPREWQEKISASGWIFLTNLVIFELVGLFSPIKFLRLDYWAHLGGYAAGTVWALSRTKMPTWGAGEKKRRGGGGG